MNRIILNFISNTIEHNENITITIKAIDGNFSTVIVEDDGLGIKNPEELFKKHISINNLGKKMVSGLGLSIVKELTEAKEVLKGKYGEPEKPDEKLFNQITKTRNPETDLYNFAQENNLSLKEAKEILFNMLKNPKLIS